MPDAKLDVLAPMVRKLTRLSPLGPPEIRVLLDLPFRLASVEARCFLVREGDTSDHCTLLLSGFAYRSKFSGDGERQILSVHMRGDLIDLQNIMLHEADHNVQALTRVDVATIPQQAILDVAAAHPAIARALWRDTLVDGSIFREWILNVGQRDARTRLSHLLCELTVLQQAAGLGEGPSYAWPITQEQLADATGLTSVHVNRTLQQMRRDGLIELSSRSITVKDRPALQKAGDFSSAYLHEVKQAA